MKPKIIIAGGGQTGRALARRLTSRWSVCVVDVDAAKQPLLLEGEFLAGDATSSLVLQQAGLPDAAAAVAVTNRDDVNLEFCRLARKLYNIPAVFASLRQSDRMADFEELGVTAISRPDAIASALQSRLEHGKRTTADVGLGQGELLEITVEPHSPVIGRPLNELNPHGWLVAAIYRRGKLVVPHGDTEVESGDRILLVGEPVVLPAVAGFFQTGDPEFPLQFGTHVGYTDPKVAQEASYLAESTRALGTLQADSDQAGCLVLSPPAPSWLDVLGFGNRRFLQRVEASRVPVLLARGSFPYKEILVAIKRDSLGAVELAIDLARVLKTATVTVAVVLPPRLVAGSEHIEQLQEAFEKAKNLRNLFRFPLEGAVLEGNPLRQTLQLSKKFDLLVTAHRRNRGTSLTRPDVSRMLLLQAPISTLVLCTGGG